MQFGRALFHQLAAVNQEQRPYTGLDRIGDDLRGDDGLAAAGRRNHKWVALAGLDLGGGPGDHVTLVGPQRGPVLGSEGRARHHGGGCDQETPWSDVEYRGLLNRLAT